MFKLDFCMNTGMYTIKAFPLSLPTDLYLRFFSDESFDLKRKTKFFSFFNFIDWKKKLFELELEYSK